MGTLNPGDRVLFKRGETFYGTIKLNKSGSQGRPITYAAYGSGAKPIITSLVTLNNWNHVGNGVYESHNPSLGSSVNVVLLNNEVQEMGRFPNSDAPNSGYLNIESTNGSNSISNGLISGSANYRGGEVVIRKSHWTIDRHPINSHSGNTIVYQPVSGTYSPIRNYGFFIQGHINTLDKYGEWYYNPSTKKLSVYFGSKGPGAVTVQASALENLVTNSSRTEHIVFDNLSFKGANKIAFSIHNANNIHVKNTDISFSGENAVYLTNLPNFTMEGSYVSYAQNSGVILNHNTPNAKLVNNKLENINVFHGMGKSGIGSGNGLEVASDNSLVEYNELINIGYIGIRFSGNNVVIKNNYISNFCLLKDDGGGIYTWTGSANTENHGRKIINNIIVNGVGSKDGTPNQHKSSAHGVAEGIYLDDNAAGVDISNNTVANTSGKGIFIHNGRNFTINGNTVYNNGVQLALTHDNLGNPIRNGKISDNIFFSKSKSQKSANILTVKLANDLKEMGSFDNNYYLRPVDDVLTIQSHYHINNYRYSTDLDLAGWKKSVGKDQNSKSSPVAIPTYKIKKITGPNQYGYGSFNNSKEASSGIYGSKSNISWSSNKLDGGALEVKGQNSSSITFATGSAKQSKHYVLKFTAMAAKDGIVNISLMKSKAPFTELAPKVTLKLTDKKGQYEAVFQSNAAESDVSVRIATENEINYWIDNVTLQEAEVEAVNIDDYIRFEYNPSKSSKTVTLDGTYVDAKNQSHSGKITLAPYSSKVLIRTSTVVTPVEQPKKVPTVKILSPYNNESIESSSVEIEAEAKDEDGQINRVEFFSGTNLLGTVRSAPYTYNVSNLAVGSYKFTAKAYDNDNQVTVSDPVVVKVSAAANEVPSKPSKPETPVKEEPKAPETPAESSYSFYLNTGSNKDLTIDGKLFKGDVNFKSYVSGTSYENNNPNGSGEPLYQTERNGENFKYEIPVPNGTYTVKTYHNELYFGKTGPSAAKGRRVYDISLEGKLVKAKFDLYSVGNKQTVLTFTKVEVKDGKLNLDLKSSANRASISGIAIEGNATPPKAEMPKAPEVPVKEEPKAPETPVKEEPKAPETPVESSYSFYLNTGSNKDLTIDGKLFKGDVNFKSYVSGTSYENNNPNGSGEPLYQTERNGENFKYEIPVPNGTYTVKTYHNELYFGKTGPSAAKGRRVYDISLEGKLVKAKFDLYSVGNKQTVLTFTKVEVKDGKLNLDLKSSANRASISGIAIEGNATPPKVETPKAPEVPVKEEPKAPETPVKEDPKAPETPAESSYSFYLNTGSSKDLTIDGKLFKGDVNFKGYVSGTSYENNNPNGSGEPLYQTERNGENFKYEIPVPNGTYTVKTYHNELYFGKTGPSAAKGRRVYDISLEGKLVKAKFDLYSVGNKQTVLTFTKVEVKDGKLNLDLKSSANRASISGIAIEGNATPLKAETPKAPETPVKEAPKAPETPAESSYSFYLNTGSNKDLTIDGKLFKGDVNFKSYVSGTSYENNNPNGSGEPLYQTERNGENFKYEIPVPNGTYTVKTYHNELYFGKTGPSAAKGRRVYDISLEGKLVKAKFDLYSVGNKQTVLTFTKVEVKDGKLNLDLKSSANRASISGIAIEGNATPPKAEMPKAPEVPVKEEPKAPETPVKEEPKAPETPVESSYSFYLNTGSNKDLTIDGKLFKGDVNFKSYVSGTS